MGRNAGYGLVFLLGLLLPFALARFGFRKVAVLLGLSAVGTLTVAVVGWAIPSHELHWVVAAAVVGIVLALVWMHWRGDNPDFLSRLNAPLTDLRHDRRKQVIYTAFAVALALTFVFARWAADPRSFWFGFYQSWTAGLVGFFFFGLATTIAALAHPEHDDFDRRVRILFGGRTGKHIDHITDSIKKIGYYSESSEKVYHIERYDAALDAYEVTVVTTSISCHFIHDIEAVDEARFRYRPDQIDGLDRPGTLISLTAEYENRCQSLIPPDGIPIPKSGIDEKWDLFIPKGQSVKLVCIHKVWLKAGETQVSRSARYSKNLSARFKNMCGIGEIDILFSLGEGALQPMSVMGGAEKFMPGPSDCAPNQIVHTFRLPSRSRTMAEDAVAAG